MTIFAFKDFLPTLDIINTDWIFMTENAEINKKIKRFTKDVLTNWKVTNQKYILQICLEATGDHSNFVLFAFEEEDGAQIFYDLYGEKAPFDIYNIDRDFDALAEKAASAEDNRFYYIE